MFVGLQSFRLSSFRAKYAWSSTAITTRHGRCCSRVHGWESFILKWNHSHLFLLLMESSPSSRNVMPSVTSSSWWKWDTHSRVNLMWSLCLLARGTWVNVCHLPAEALMQSSFYFVVITLFCVCRWITPSTCSADLDDVLRFGSHPWWGDCFAPTWHLCCWDSGKPSRGEGMVWAHKGHPPQLYSYWIQTSNWSLEAIFIQCSVLGVHHKCLVFFLHLQ